MHPLDLMLKTNVGEVITSFYHCVQYLFIITAVLMAY